MLRVAVVDNASALAYRHGFAPLDAVFDPQPPTEILRAVAAGRCDAALLPVASLSRVAPRYGMAAPYGIGCRGPVTSVAFFSRHPLAEMIESRSRIFVSEKSQTSRTLFSALCERVHGTAPVIVSEPSIAAGQLLIGDEAIAAHHAAHAWPHSIDLGQWWHEVTGLPFVFAVWICRNDLTKLERSTFCHWLDRTTSHAESVSGQTALAEALMKLGYPAAWCHRYMQGLHYRLDTLDLQAMDQFHAWTKKEPEWAANA